MAVGYVTGLALMVGLGVYLLLAAIKPHMPLTRGIYAWYGHTEFTRAGNAVTGVAMIAGAVYFAVVH